MKPYDLLTTKDKEIILELFLQGCGPDIEISDEVFENILQTWSNSKQEIFNSIFKDSLILSYNIYKTIGYADGYDYHLIVDDFLKNNNLSDKEFYFNSYQDIINNSISRDLNTTNFIFKKGTKYSTVLKTTLKKENKSQEEINTVLINYSKLRQSFITKGTICFSIHPIDFLTMSLNNCKWSSCCNIQNGEYKKTAIEMMMDEYTISTYVPSNSISLNINNNLIWNSKKWRCHYVLDCKNKIAVQGDQYPFDFNLLINQINMILIKKLKIESPYFVDAHTIQDKINYSILSDGQYCFEKTLYDNEIIKEKENIVIEIIPNLICPSCGYPNHDGENCSFICYNCRTPDGYCSICGAGLYSNDHECGVYIEDDDKNICFDCYDKYYTSCYECFIHIKIKDSFEYNDKKGNFKYYICTECNDSHKKKLLEWAIQC